MASSAGRVRKRAWAQPPVTVRRHPGEGGTVITRLHLENFKAWKAVDLEFGQLTGIFGANSAGKSSRQLSRPGVCARRE